MSDHACPACGAELNCITVQARDRIAQLEYEVKRLSIDLSDSRWETGEALRARDNWRKTAMEGPNR